MTPTPRLRDTLNRLGVGDRELSRVAREVSRRGRGLPPFDSLWIDALLAAGSLTPFQADAIHDGRDDSLLLGPFRVTDRLGRRTFAVADRDGGRRAAKSIDDPDEVGRCRDAISLPEIDLVVDGDRVLLVGDMIEGPNLRDLLVRSGRFPTAVVAAIARVLAADLSNRPPHGQLTLENVRIDPRGRTVAVDGGAEAILAPHGRPGRYLETDMLATLDPLRAERRDPPRELYDLYAFGAIIFELLTGGSTHPEADPFARLAAKRTRPAPDPAEAVSDCPDELRDAVVRCLSPDREGRPAGFAEVAAVLGPPGRGDETRVGAFVRGGRSPLTRLWGETSPSPASRERANFSEKATRAAVATAAACVAAACVWLAGGAGPARTLSAATGEAVDSAADSPTASPAIDVETRSLRPWPAPDPEGVIVFPTDGPYQSADLDWPGDLTLRAAGGAVPVVRVTDGPVTLDARRITIEGVDFVADGSFRGRAVVMATSGSLRVDGSRIGRAGTAGGHGRSAGIAWRPRDGGRGAVSLRRCVARRLDAAVHLAATPASLEISESLIAGCGAAIRFARGGGRSADIRLESVTVRGGAVLAANGEALPETVSTSRCVFGPGRLIGAGDDVLGRTCRFVDAGSLIDTRTGTTGAVIDGMTPGTLTFPASVDATPADAARYEFRGPRRAGATAGVEPTTLAKDTRTAARLEMIPARPEAHR